VRPRDHTHGDIDRGIVNIVVGFAPTWPAEFVIISIQQMSDASRRCRAE
jgi:phage tail sheath protein FI